MNREIVSSLVLFIFCAGCGSAPTPVQETDVFLTAPLPLTVTPQAKPSPTLPAATQQQENIQPVEGIVTTQLNVRAEPSTAGKALGTLEIFSKVNVVGKTAGGAWYKILYEAAEGGTGWVRSEYVQVEAEDALQVVALKPETASGISGVIVQKVNVRKEAGTDSEPLGTLNPQDFVSIIGRNADGTWLQIEFAAAPGGRGWVAAEFVQAEKIEDASLVGKEEEIPAPPASASLAPMALEGDSPQSPLAAVFFSPAAARAAQWDGSLSAEDSEDWFRFSAAYEIVLSIKAECAAGKLRAELWENQKAANDISCGERLLFPIQAEKEYLLRLTQNEDGFTAYRIFMEVIP